MNANNAFLILQLPYYQFIEFNLTTYVCVNKLLKSVFCSHFNECISVSSDFFSISSVAVYNLEIRKKRKINAKSKQTNKFCKKEKKIHTPVEYYLCQTMMLLLLKKQGKIAKNLYFCESLKFCNIS